MTNIEAIKLIEISKAEVEWNYPMDYQIAFDMAIEALKKYEQLRIFLKSLMANNLCVAMGNYTSSIIKEFADKLKQDFGYNDYYCEDIDFDDWIDKMVNKCETEVFKEITGIEVKDNE